MANGMTRCLIAGLGLALCSSASLAQVDARGHNLGTTPDTREGRAAQIVFQAGASNCCVANGGVGCDDAECQALICGADPFCCETAWDGICADAANAQCEACSGGGSNCCVANGGTGCDDAECQGIVCAFDPFCCNTAWDGVCAGEAIEFCPVCGGGGDPDLGACCNSTVGPCDDTVETACVANGGIFQGVGTSCAAGDCDGGGGQCPGAGGDCCVADGTPGCDDIECCSAICAADPFCCDTAWDQICADAALGQCNCEIKVCELECPGGSDCAGDTDGDGDTDSVDLNNVLAGFGCGTDGDCGPGDVDGDGDVDSVDLNVVLGAFGCGTGDGGSQIEAEACGDDTNGGCNSPVPAFEATECGATICGTAWADANLRDTDWFSFTVAPGTLVTATLTSQFNGVVFVVDASNCAAPAVLGVTGSSNDCVAGPSAQACIDDGGEVVVFVATAAFAGTPCGNGDNDYVVTISCESGCKTPPNPACTPEAGDCCTPNGAPGCNDFDCCSAICAADPFCCDVAWDGLCADAALVGCEVCAGGGGSNCCIPNGGVGCDDAECQALICGADPFCCDTAWDGICADAANAQCAVCSGGASNCCVANGGVGCDDAECQAIVCGFDPFCCNTAWDGVCAGEAAEFCPVCGGGGEPTLGACCNSTVGPCDDTVEEACVANGGIFQGKGTSCAAGDCGGGGGSNCCSANGGIGCDDPDCQAQICGADAFCCDVAWDQICADAAVAGCAVCQ